MSIANPKSESQDIKVGDFVTLKWIHFNSELYEFLVEVDRSDEWENTIGLVVDDCYQGDPMMTLLLIEEKAISFRKAQLRLLEQEVGIDF